MITKHQVVAARLKRNMQPCTRSVWKDSSYCWSHVLQYDEKRRSRAAKVGVMVTIIGLLLSVDGPVQSHIYQARQEAKEKTKSLAGELVPPDRALDPNVISVYWCASAAAWDANRVAEGNFAYHPFRGVRIQFADGRLRVSARVFSTDGKHVAELVENEWKINANNYFDRNFDERSLEVLTLFTTYLVLQIVFLDAHCLPWRASSRAATNSSVVLTRE